MKDTLYMAMKEYRLAWIKLFRAMGVYKFYQNPLVIKIAPYIAIAWVLFIAYQFIILFYNQAQ